MENTMKKMTWEELCKYIREYNKKNDNSYCDVKKHLIASVVFSNDSWNGHDYSLEDRTYTFDNVNKYWYGDCCGNSLYATCPGESDMVRLDWYLSSWKVEYCYIVHEE